jgi:two-component system sensor histidine kinase KdpD
VAGSLGSVLLFNWFFIDPKFSFHTYEPEYVVTFAVMLVSSLITGTLANRMKLNARQSAREAFRTKVLLDTNQLLQKAECPEEAVETTAHQIITLLSRDVVIFPRTQAGSLGAGMTFRAAYGAEDSVPDENEGKIARWVFENQRSAGYRLDRFEGAAAQYHAICLNGYCYGVIAIRLDRAPLEPYENSIVVSILGECALALENLRNAAEKEQADLMVRKEQLRSNLLRSISHDIRTPLTSISGNASNLLSHYGQLDDETRRQIFSDIYDDAEWLIDLVENLLSISRIENGQMELHLSSEVMGDVIEEALKHADRNAARHHVTVRATDDILLVDMDARLIMQVLINLINNAVKNTPEGSHILIESRRAGSEAEVIVRDDGPGIPDDVKPHVFEMFYTGQNKVADGRRGLGLGLALCKAIVESHGGRIFLTDSVPTGCCFTVSLPMKEVQVDE